MSKLAELDHEPINWIFCEKWMFFKHEIGESLTEKIFRIKFEIPSTKSETNSNV